MRDFVTGLRPDPRVLLLVVGLAIVLAGCSSTSAPSRMPLGFREEREFSDHREIDLVWESAADGAHLSGSLYLPLDPGPHAVMVMHHGSHRWSREPWNYLYSLYLDHGIAVFSYVRRRMLPLARPRLFRASGRRPRRGGTGPTRSRRNRSRSRGRIWFQSGWLGRTRRGRGGAQGNRAGSHRIGPGRHAR